MTRPEHLPDFDAPPLHEVALGVQYAPIQEYQQILAGEVWNLFREDFPLVEEHQALSPMFETFGLPQSGQRINLGIVTGIVPDRYWFLTANKEELIQFQHDRMLHNWRKIGDGSNEYPRFENMVVKFENELRSLEKFYSDISKQEFQINQCEVTYINHIQYNQDTMNGLPDEWIRFLKFDELDPSDFVVRFRRVILDNEDKPYGRLICDVNSAFDDDKGPIILLNIVARGAPRETNIDSALEFLRHGRELVVNLFAEVTTHVAHERWERTQ